MQSAIERCLSLLIASSLSRSCLAGTLSVCFIGLMSVGGWLPYTLEVEQPNGAGHCSGFRLEPRLLQQYANLQQQSPMASVRIPPPVHDGGGLYNPFNAGPLGPPPPRDLQVCVAHPKQSMSQHMCQWQGYDMTSGCSVAGCLCMCFSNALLVTHVCRRSIPACSGCPTLHCRCASTPVSRWCTLLHGAAGLPDVL